MRRPAMRVPHRPAPTTLVLLLLLLLSACAPKHADRPRPGTGTGATAATAAVERLTAAFNAHDVEALVAAVDPQVDWLMVAPEG